MKRPPSPIPSGDGGQGTRVRGGKSRTRAAQLKSTSLKECLKGEPLKAGQRSSGAHVSRASFSATGCSPRLTCPHVLPHCTAKLYPDCSRLAVTSGPQAPTFALPDAKRPRHDESTEHRGRARASSHGPFHDEAEEPPKDGVWGDGRLSGAPSQRPRGDWSPLFQ